MKRLCTFLCLFLILSSMGCLAKPAQVALTEENDGQTVAIKTGGEIILRLKANISTGYSWSVQDLDEQFLQQQGEEEYKSDSNLIGSGGTSTFTFKAKQPGRTTLNLVYSRPFEKDTPPEKTFEIIIKIE